MGGSANLGFGLDAAQQGQHLRLDAGQRLGRLSFKAQHQHRGGVAGADQAKAIGPIDAQAVDGGDLRRGGKRLRGQGLQLGGQGVRLALGAGHVQLRGAVRKGQGIEHGAGVGVGADNFQQAAAGVGAIVKAVPALFKKDVATHLAAQRGVQLFHAGFDQRVAGFVHVRHPPGSANGWGQLLAAFHIKQNRCAGIAREHILGEQHQLAIRKDVLPIFGDDAQAVAIAIKGQANFGIRILQRGHQVTQVFGLAGVGVVVGEVAIDLRKQFDHFTAQGTKNAWCRGPGNAVAAIDDDFHGAFELDIAQDALAVSGQHVLFAQGGAALQLPILGLDALVQGLDLSAVNRPPSQHHFEAVVILGVVAAGDLDTAGAQRAGGKVQHGGGALANVDDRYPHVHQPGDQRLAQRWPRQAAIAAHGHGGLLCLAGGHAKGPAQGAGHVGIQGAGHDAAHVIGFEDGGGNVHVRGRESGQKKAGHRCPAAL